MFLLKYNKSIYSLLTLVIIIEILFLVTMGIYISHITKKNET